MARPSDHNIFKPETFIFWLERFLMLGLYLSPWFFPASRPLILPAITILLIFSSNILYLAYDENEYSFSFLERWAPKDRYAFILERCSMFVLVVFFWWIVCPHDAAAAVPGYYDYKWLVAYLLVFIIFPLANFMYTPCCPFLQKQETKKIPKLNEKAPTSEHHQSLKCPTKLRKINQTWKNADPRVVKHRHNRVTQAEHSMKLFDKENDIPPLEEVEHGNSNALNPAKTGEISIEESYKQTLLAAKLQNQDEGKEISHGIALEMSLKMIHGRELCPSELFYVKLVKELDVSFEKRLKEMCANHEEQKQKWQEERLSLASELEELEANGKKMLKEMRAKHEKQKQLWQVNRWSLFKELEACCDEWLKKKCAEREELKQKLEEERLILASNLEEVEDGNNNNVLPEKTVEISIEKSYNQTHEAAKTQDFSHGVALEMTLKTIYSRDLSNNELFYVKIVKELEASWEKKLKEKQDMLKEMSEKHEEQNQKWEEERMSFVSELAAAKSEATLYHSLLLNNSHYYFSLMEEKNDLAEKLTQATAACEVYRSLLHNLEASV